MATGTLTSPAPVLATGSNGMHAQPIVNDDILYEVVDNQVRELPPMSARETRFASNFSRILGNFAVEHAIGLVDVDMLFLINQAENLQRRPDVSFVSFDRWPRNRPVPGTAAWEVVPNLAVEVVSPSNSANEVIEKLEDYFAAGVERVWVIFPLFGKVYDYDSTDSVRILSRTGTLDGGAVLPDFRLPLSELFEEHGEPA